MNIGIYGPHRGRSHFSLTERAILTTDRRHDSIRIGQSEMGWRSSDDLLVHLDERTAPGPFARGGAPIRGTIRLTRESECTEPRELAPGHFWQASAPLAAIDVNLDEPNVHFRGHGYHDANWGVSPLETAFQRWSWSRARLHRQHRAAVIYDTVDRVSGNPQHRAFLIDRDGLTEELAAVRRPTSALPRTMWGIPRSTRLDDHGKARLIHDLEDGPFYARSLLSANVCGEDVIAMHEEMSCTRLARSWVRFLVGFRMAQQQGAARP